MYMLNMVIILIVMYCNVVTAIDKIPTYLLRFNSLIARTGHHQFAPSVASSNQATVRWNARDMSIVGGASSPGRTGLLGGIGAR